MDTSADYGLRYQREPYTLIMFANVGDRIHDALIIVGVTDERVSRLIKNCRCPERRDMMNRIGAWADRVIAGKTEKALEYLEQIIGD